MNSVGWHQRPVAGWRWLCPALWRRKHQSRHGWKKTGKVGVRDETDWVAQHLLWIQDVFGKHKKYLAHPVKDLKTVTKVNPVYCSLWVTDAQIKADVSSNTTMGLPWTGVCSCFYGSLGIWLLCITDDAFRCALRQWKKGVFKPRVPSTWH